MVLVELISTPDGESGSMIQEFYFGVIDVFDLQLATLPQCEVIKLKSPRIILLPRLVVLQDWKLLIDLPGMWL
jgi:hypothetical protein